VQVDEIRYRLEHVIGGRPVTVADDDARRAQRPKNRRTR
jgi:hypothetical protein